MLTRAYERSGGCTDRSARGAWMGSICAVNTVKCGHAPNPFSTGRDQRSRTMPCEAHPCGAPGKTGSNSPCPHSALPTRNSLRHDPKHTRAVGWSARTVCGRSILAVISARYEHAPNLSSTGASPRSRTMPCEAHSCAAAEFPSSGNDQTFPVSKFSLRFEKKAVPE